MTENYANLPRVVSRDGWTAAHKELLVGEKELTRKRDALGADRRRLPMVKSKRSMSSEDPTAKWACSTCLRGAANLIVSHFMFDPGWEEGCELFGKGHWDLRQASRSSALPGHHVRLRLPRATREDPGLQDKQGMDFPLVLFLRQRLQLRLPRHTGQVRCPRSSTTTKPIVDRDEQSAEAPGEVPSYP